MFKIPTFEFKLASNVACMEKIVSLLSFTIFSLMEATIYIILLHFIHKVLYCCWLC